MSQHLDGANALAASRGLRDLAAMDVSALMEVVATRDQLPVMTTATVVEVEEPMTHPAVGDVLPLTILVEATESSSEFQVRTAVNTDLVTPVAGDVLAVTFRFDAPNRVAVIGPA